ALDGDADLLAIANLEADARGLAALGVLQHHIAGPKGRGAVDDAGLGELLGALVALDDVGTRDDDAAILADVEDAALDALVLAGHDDHEVVLLETYTHQITSGASETIFMKRLPRSSRATGPKMRVPIGSPSLLMRTALFA